ncbi:MAG TPA: hypothetical protein PLA90_17570, partial [Candidatus Sumerlaeota bacterium]|nr:hypothetical protein [Candidatus Sumerlaeota bacterium]
ANPLVSGQPLLFVVRAQYRPDHHNTETMFVTGECNTSSFVGGGALKTIDLAREGAVTTLLETKDGLARDPEVRFDGKRIVFSQRQNIQDDYKLYEMNADGNDLKQLTFAKGVADIDPFYLADGDIGFSSTREPKYCMCNIHIMANLFRMKPDGTNIEQIGKNTLFEGHGSLLPDGRILYDRWEYVDRNFGDAQGLWTVAPDGANHALYAGNNTPAPGGMIDGRAIPGTQRVICIFGACHDRPWGALAILDRRQGLEGRAPVVRTWPAEAADLATTEGHDLWDATLKMPVKYEDPYPLNERYFLCSRMTGEGEQMGIYLLDVFGNEILLHTEGAGCYDPMPLGPRPCPPVVPSRKSYKEQNGVYYVQDVYLGTHMQGVERGTVKFLRVVESGEKRFWTDPAWGGQGVERPAMNWHDFSNKRVLGTVPVEDDGSACFQAPTGRFLYFQLLDKDGMMVQSMRSGTFIQPGESNGCVGCHESRVAAPPSTGARSLKALLREPSRLTEAAGDRPFFNYIQDVQPIFDRSCVECHDYGKKAGKALNLAGDQDLTFNTSYNELWRKQMTGAIGAGPAQIQQPRAWGSQTSKLVKKLLKGHARDKISKDDLARIVTWVDLNAPYYPEYASAYPDNLAGRAPLDKAQLARLQELTGVPFGELADNGRNRGPQVCFERPELSPCLAKLSENKDARYEEALAIVKAGQARLAANPNPGLPGFQPCPTDQAREKRYQTLLKFQNEVRAAILKKETV